MPQFEQIEVFQSLIFWSVLSFAILFFILKKFAFPPILSALDEREKNIESELDAMDEERDGIISKINKKMVAHYERLLDTKEGKVIVGVDHGSCGGCHMKLQTQEIVNAKSGREMATCTNCGRLIYYTREMVMADELD